MLFEKTVAIENHTKPINTFYAQNEKFLGAFAKLQKVTMSFVMSVCPSVRMEQLGSHWTNFDET